jgi:hypothetical protein
VCPSWLWTDDGAKERFHDFLDDLSRCRGRWDSLSIGRHPFETNHRDSDNLQSHSRIAGQSSSRVFRTAEAERPSIHRKVRRTHRTGGIFPISNLAPAPHTRPGAASISDTARIRIRHRLSDISSYGPGTWLANLASHGLLLHGHPQKVPCAD